uniref:NADH dehydrogenase subunit 3 n=1 Tax=Tetrapedia diversipes TaxID=889126 RepID=UPI001EF9CC88|nr:NADH dehydrogenase subunit 3 [Tetrapedia diversipes]UKG21059.1 NADH dehydrogenase subunit 3 [Tetrapedia diversipes]
MFYYLLFSITIIIITFILYLINLMITMIKPMNLEKNIPFECGFTPMTKANLPFSLPFYMVLMLFLIFDVEIVLLIPMIMYMNILNNMYLNFTILFFFLILIYTLILELIMGYLNWMF